MEHLRFWPHFLGMKVALVLVSLSLMSHAQDDWRRALDRAKVMQLTDPGAATREFQTAENLAKQVDGKSLVVVWTDWAGVLISQGRHRDAEATLRKALAVQDQNPDIPAASRAALLNGLALTQVALGRREESIDLLRKGIGLLEGATGVDRAALLPNISLLIALYIETGRMGDARLTAEKAVGLARRIGNDRDLAQCWILLSEIERSAGDYDEARRAARSALKLIGPPTPVNYPSFEAVHNQLARIAYETSDYRMAATHWKLTLDSLRARRSDTDEDVLSVRADIARIALVEGRLEEAKNELIPVVKLAGDHGRQAALARGLYVLGAVYARKKQLEEASAVLIRSLAISDKVFGEMSAHSASCVADLASIYLKAGRPAEAAQFSGRAARIAADDDAAALIWLDVMQVHAQVLRKLNRKAEAKDVHQRASRLVGSKPIRNHTIDVMDLTRQ